MKYLVDANVLCEPTKPEPDPHAVAWLSRREPDLVLDPIILGEVRFGILLLPTGQRRSRLERWFQEGVRRVHCVDWDAHTGLAWAQLVTKLRSEGLAMPVKDSMIAATALARGLIVATRNSRDFEKAGVEVVDPFSDSSH